MKLIAVRCLLAAHSSLQCEGRSEQDTHWQDIFNSLSFDISLTYLPSSEAISSRTCSSVRTFVFNRISAAFSVSDRKKNGIGMSSLSKRPPPFTISTITYKVVLYAPAERAGTLPLFLLYPYKYSVVHTMAFRTCNVQLACTFSLTRHYALPENTRPAGFQP